MKTSASVIGVAFCLAQPSYATQPPKVTAEYRVELRDARPGLVELRQLLRCGGNLSEARGRAYVAFSIDKFDYLATALHAVLPKRDLVAAEALEDSCTFSLELKNTDSAPEEDPLSLSSDEVLEGLLAREGLVDRLAGIPHYESDPGALDIVLLRVPSGHLEVSAETYVPVQCGQESPRQLEGAGLVTWIAGPSDEVLATDVSLTDGSYWQSARPVKKGDSGSPVFATLRQGCRRELALVGVVSWTPPTDSRGRLLDQSETFRPARVTALWDQVINRQDFRRSDKDPALLKLAYVADVARRILNAYPGNLVGALEPGELKHAVGVANEVLRGTRYCECEGTALRFSYFLSEFEGLGSLDGQPSFGANVSDTARRALSFLDFRGPSKIRTSVAKYEADVLVASAEAYYAGYPADGAALTFGLGPDLEALATRVGAALQRMREEGDAQQPEDDIDLLPEAAATYLKEEYERALAKKDGLLLRTIEPKLAAPELAETTRVRNDGH